ncbi:hypothetical protein NDU88_002962, partial [Pleurodeles waltl]
CSTIFWRTIPMGMAPLLVKTGAMPTTQMAMPRGQMFSGHGHWDSAVQGPKLGPERCW